MAYRQDSADALEAPTSDGILRAELSPRSVKLSVAKRTLHIADHHATIVENKPVSAKIPDGTTTQEIVVRSRFGVTVWGDYLRFADPRGTDLAKISIPWLAPEDRDELARRISQLVDREQASPPVWPPRS